VFINFNVIDYKRAEMPARQAFIFRFAADIERALDVYFDFQIISKFRFHETLTPS
jgi:hypothetical protein